MAKREDPLAGFHFAVDIQGVVTGYFTECSGLGSEHEVIEQKEVDANGREVIVKIPGRLKWDNITLKRGITSSMDLWEWRKQVEDGNLEKARKSGSIVMYDQHHKEVARWAFERAWPISLRATGPQPKSDSNQIGIEELTITHDYIKRVS